MKKIVVGFLLSFLAIFVGGCATPLTVEEKGTIRSVGVFNQFPDKPNYVVIGTTIFNNDYDEIPDSSYRVYLDQVVEDYFEAKGYSVRSLAEDESVDDVDLAVVLIPRDIYQMPGTHGFGVTQRSILGNAFPAQVYVALNLHSKFKGRMVAGGYKAVLREFSQSPLPATWESLPESKKAKVHEKLREGIRTAIHQIFQENGI